MNMNDNVRKIGEIKFKDILISVYYDKHIANKNPICSWQIRNPDTDYVGTVFMNNETGKIIYPEGAIIPEQTDRDREMLPKFIISGEEVMTDEFISKTSEYLEKDYKLRNKLK